MIDSLDPIFWQLIWSKTFFGGNKGSKLRVEVIKLIMWIHTQNKCQKYKKQWYHCREWQNSKSLNCWLCHSKKILLNGSSMNVSSCKFGIFWPLYLFHLPLYTLFCIQMVESCLIAKCSGIWMPFEYQTKFNVVFRLYFENRTGIQLVVRILDHPLNTAFVKVHYSDGSVIQMSGFQIQLYLHLASASK